MKTIKKYSFAFVLLFCVLGCETENKREKIVPVPQQTVLPDGKAASDWGKMTLDMMWMYPANSPTYGSRALGLMGLTMYETVVYGDPKRKSMANQLNGLQSLPTPPRGQKINYTVAMNAGQAFMIKKIYFNLTPAKLQRLDSLENAIYTNASKTSDGETIERSKKYGLLVANSIYEWSKGDGGHNAIERNFDPNYKFPRSTGKWIPPLAGQIVSGYPLHPYWPKCRTMAIENGNIPVPEYLTYSTLPSSEYYKQFKEVHDKRLTLTQEEKEIAAWWADDPTETFSPPGHSYSIAVIVTRKENVDLFKAAETFAKVGMAVCDAFINCWKAKYTYHSERPFPYILRLINRNYQQFWPEPPFPAFYSGHSVQGSAAATVLENIYGLNYTFEDITHLGREKDWNRFIDYKTRKYVSFKAMAEESAYSRLLGGIHIRFDNEVGLEEGKKVGANINKLQWFK